MAKEQAVSVTLFVKAEDVEQARDVVVAKLNEWFVEAPNQPPFPIGTLLWYAVNSPKPSVEDDGYVTTFKGEGCREVRNDPEVYVAW